MNIELARRTILSASVAALLLATIAYTYSRPAQAQEAEAEIEAAAQELVDGFNAGDAEAFADLFTDEGLLEFVEEPEGTTRAEAIAIVEEFMGFATVELLDLRDIDVNGDTASAILELDLGGFVSIDRVAFARIDGNWLVSGYATGVEQPAPPEIPAGYRTVPVDLREYAFDFDASPIRVGDNVAFEATNVGQETHELVLIKVPEDLDLEAVLDSPEPPEGVEDIAWTYVISGATGVAIAPNALAAGRYVMLCFVETDGGVPHVALGMIAEFTLEDDNGVTPTPGITPTPGAPATGTGTAAGSAPVSPLVIGFGLAMLALGGAAAGRAVIRNR